MVYRRQQHIDFHYISVKQQTIMETKQGAFKVEEHHINQLLSEQSARCLSTLRNHSLLLDC